jgi:hypothetical protein
MTAALRFNGSPQPFAVDGEVSGQFDAAETFSRTVPHFDSIPNLLPDSVPASNSLPNRRELDYLLRRLTPRDLVILLALHQYRFLDQGQIQTLFFRGPRSTQYRIAWLRQHGLLHRWRRMRPHSWSRLPSVLAPSVRGAAVLADATGLDRRAAIRRSEHAVAFGFHLVHDLEANGFFVDLAAAVRSRDGEGLHSWIGDWSSREIYRARGARFAPDGSGRYLTPSGEVVFLLEWDRGTESPHRIALKAAQYVAYFRGRLNAQLSTVLFVVFNPAREVSVRDAIGSTLPPAGIPCCTFWTADLTRLRAEGPLGPIWLDSRGTSADRRPLAGLPQQPRSLRSAPDSICKPVWWERRPGGGEGA